MSITWPASRRGMNGRWHLTPLWGILSIHLCCLGWRIPLSYFRLWWMTHWEILNSFVFVCIDYILILSQNLEEYKQHIILVLQRLLENNLYVKTSREQLICKCESHGSSVSFLGFVVERGQLKADPAKIQAIAEWPVLTTHKDLQRLLRITNFYRKFIIIAMVARFTQMTSSKITFVWSIFWWLECMFTTAPTLHHPDPSRQSYGNHKFLVVLLNFQE